MGSTALERTRALIIDGLAVKLSDQLGDAYRDPSGKLLEGEWVGAFAQPSFMLNTVTAFSAQLTDRTGAMEDEYGKSHLTVARVEDRVTFEKRYREQRFVYVGKLYDGVIAGYWYAPIRPTFGGIFWMTRTDRLREDALTAFRSRVRATSPRRAMVKILLTSLMVASGIGLTVYLPLALGSFAAFMGITMILNRRMQALRVEIEQWKRELGEPSGNPGPAS